MIAVDEQLSFRCRRAGDGALLYEEAPKPVQAAAVPANKETSGEGRGRDVCVPIWRCRPGKRRKRSLPQPKNKATNKNSAAAGSGARVLAVPDRRDSARAPATAKSRTSLGPGLVWKRAFNRPETPSCTEPCRLYSRHSPDGRYRAGRSRAVAALEGGALGIGGGGGGFLTGRGTANLLTRMTAILAAGFFLTSITLTLISRHPGPAGSILDRQVAPAAAPETPAAPGAAAPAAPGTPATDTPRGGILDKLK